MSKEQTPEIRFEGFSDDWEQRKLGDVIENLYNGQTPSRTNPDFWNGELNWLSSGELNRGTVLSTIEKITVSGQKDANLRIVSKGTFVIAITGLEAAGTRGNCSKLGIDTTMNQSCMAIYPQKKLLETNFLFQWYRKNGEQYGLRYTQGTKQQSYNAELLKILPITLPIVTEQIKISTLLNKLDNTITLQERELNLLKEQKKGFLQKMFPKTNEKVPEIRFEGFSDDWEQRKLGEVLNIVDGDRGKNYPSGNDFFHLEHTLFLSATNVTKKGFTFEDNQYITEEKSNSMGNGKVQLDDIILTSRGSIGHVAWYNSEIQKNISFARINSGMLILRPIEIIKSSFIVQYLKSPLGEKQIKLLSFGSAQPQLTKKDVSNFKLIVTSKEEQTKIGNFFKQLDNTITLQEEQLKKLKEMKKGFLQKMFV